MPDVIKKVGCLLSAAIGLALLVNGLSPRGIPLMGQWDTRQGVVTADSAAAALWMDFEIPDPAAAKQIFDAGGALFVDVRSREMFAEGHIPGAVSLPLGELDAHMAAFAQEVPCGASHRNVLFGASLPGQPHGGPTSDGSWISKRGGVYRRFSGMDGKWIPCRQAIERVGAPTGGWTYGCAGF